MILIAAEALQSNLTTLWAIPRPHSWPRLSTHNGCVYIVFFRRNLFLRGLQVVSFAKLQADSSIPFFQSWTNIKKFSVKRVVFQIVFHVMAASNSYSLLKKTWFSAKFDAESHGFKNQLSDPLEKRSQTVACLHARWKLLSSIFFLYMEMRLLMLFGV